MGKHEDANEAKCAVEKEGRRCILLSGDVADSEFCRDAVEKTVGEFGKLDILVNNAAFQEHVNSFEELTEEHFDRTIKTNLYGYFFMHTACPNVSIATSKRSLRQFGVDVDQACR